MLECFRKRFLIITSLNLPDFRLTRFFGNSGRGRAQNSGSHCEIEISNYITYHLKTPVHPKISAPATNKCTDNECLYMEKVANYYCSGEYLSHQLPFRRGSVVENLIRTLV